MINIVTQFNEKGNTLSIVQSELIFLLMQDNAICGGARDIRLIDYSKIDVKKSWSIVAGLECEGVRTIIGPIVDFTEKSGSKYFRLTSSMDGYSRFIGRSGDSVDVIVSRIVTMANLNKFDDHANLSKIHLIGCNS